MIWARFIKWYRFFVLHENVSARYIKEEIKKKRRLLSIAKKSGLKDIKLFILHTENQFSLGDNSYIQKRSWIWCHDNSDSREWPNEICGSLSIGRNSYIGCDFHADCFDEVTIGDDCLLADEITIQTAFSGMNPELPGGYRKQPYAELGKVTIGNGCWIGSRVTILANVAIGDKCIIGANAVVTKDIPPYSIAVGIPARVIKQWNFQARRWDNL